VLEIIHNTASFSHTSWLIYLCMLLYVMRLNFATLSFAFVVNREIVSVWGIIIANLFDSFYNKLYYIFRSK